MLGLATFALLATALPNAVVLRPVANMYSKPSTDAEVVSQAIYGANVTLLEESNGWAHIRTGDDYTGWTPLADLRSGPVYATSRAAEVVNLFAHIYREASLTKHAPLVTVPFEARLETVAPPGPSAHWIEVRLPDDRAGWIQTADIAFDVKPLSIPEMLALARRFIGVAPYTWGGTSSFGYDCSGFMQMLERQRGVFLPRDAQPQADWTGVEAVRREDLQPGDLLYFGTSDRHITHTGMYIGDGKFVNATAPMVRIDDLNDPRRSLVAMRRVKAKTAAADSPSGSR
jgi:gamma-D-glutamyl-L-lysine dipeptidyl-peptidase